MTPNEHAEPVEGEGAPSARRLISRRALVRAGWTVPVVLALHLPVNAFAQYACGVHTDVPAQAHADAGVPPAHADVPAQAHVDVCA